MHTPSNSSRICLSFPDTNSQELTLTTTTKLTQERDTETKLKRAHPKLTDGKFTIYIFVRKNEVLWDQTFPLNLPFPFPNHPIPPLKK